MKEEIITEMKEYLSLDLYEAMDEWYDLDNLAHKLDRLFREEIASMEDSIDPYGPDTIREKFI